MTALIRKKPAHTVLLVTPKLQARIDLVGRKNLEVLACWSQQRKSTQLDDAIVQAANLGPRVLGKLLIVSTDFWAEAICLPTDILAIASGQELQRALAIEAELGSGIAAFNSQIGYQRLADEDSNVSSDSSFFTTQVEDVQLSSLEKTAASIGISAEFRLAHPVLFQLDGQSTAATATRDLAWWNDANSPIDSRLGDFAESACRSIRSKIFDSACVTSTYKPSKFKQFGVSLATSSLAIAFCVSWSIQRNAKFNATSLAISRIEKQQKELSDTTSALKQAESKLVRLTKEARDAHQAQSAIESRLRIAQELQSKQNGRWSHLLEALSKQAGDCWVQRIESDLVRTVIHGYSLSNASAHEFAAALEYSLLDLGWVFSPAATQLTDSGLYQFSIVLKLSDAKPSNTKSSEVVQLKETHSTNEILDIARFAERRP